MEGDSSERFGLFWPGKKRALRAAQEPTTATLKPDFENSKDWDTTKNVFIEGDNLEVLKILQKHYHAKIKMIYIDPPYNTGNVDELKDVDLMSEECPIRFIITVEALSEGLGLPVRLCPGNRREVVHELCGHLYFLLYDVVRVVIFNGSDGKHGLVLAAVDSSAPRQKLFDHLFGKGRTVMDSGG